MRPRRIVATITLIFALALGSVGCIRSSLEITSEPPGANVKFQDCDRGQTPVKIPFIWYWYYDIELEKPGYQTLKTQEYLATPPWFLFPLDLFFEALPFPIPDTRHRHYNLEPLPAQP
ncbi:PEGA domain-containing protein [Candidatus Sumerlaeota bacterium]|nr:PEGA domain-containing protein [Candidatus Sumerlaeota bacterium]